MDATCKQIATKLLLHLKQQSQKKTKENVPQNTKENADQRMERFPVGWRKRLQTTCKCCQKDTIILATSTSLYILAVNLVEILTHLRILIEQS